MKASVSVELRPESSGTPIHAATPDLSLGGCYIEKMFTLPVGENLEMIVRFRQVCATGPVKVRFFLVDLGFGRSERRGGPRRHNIPDDSPPPGVRACGILERRSGFSCFGIQPNIEFRTALRSAKLGRPRQRCCAGGSYPYRHLAAVRPTRSLVLLPAS